MGKINVLDKHMAELIAAGEVVERPSSVIKELVENSIDSGATAITVEIIDGGTTMMRVTDNGSGIMRDDVRNAFKRHATSKLKDPSDLDAIGTLGFRGEALASISAVARVELITKADEDEIGTHYIIEGGEEKLFEDAGCPNGTTFIVSDLFYNVPARMKFLKKNVSEGTAVAAVVDKIALSHSEVAITFIREHKKVLATSGDGSDKNCIYSVLGREFTNCSVPVDYELNGVTVKGYVTKPQGARASRAMQNFFINGRYVKSRTAMAALEEACRGMVMVGKYPGCVLHIGLTFSQVDVNVHPSKIEVRFANERPIFEAVYHAVKTALTDRDTVKQINLEPRGSVQTLAERSAVRKPYSMTQYEVNNIKNSPYIRPPLQDDSKSIGIYSDLLKNQTLVFNDPSCAANVLTVKPPIIPTSPERTFEIKAAAPAEKYEVQNDIITDAADEIEPQTEMISNSADMTQERSADENTDEQIKPLVDVSDEAVRFIGEAFKTYIIIERGNKLILVDKHALHERIIYERLIREQGKKYAQFLLEPIAVVLSKAQYVGVIEKKDLLSESGFEIDDFGGSTILVRSAPSFLDAGDVAMTIEEMADHIIENRNNIESEYTDWLYHNIACRSAIKGGDKSTPQELVDLYIKMGEDTNYRYCPHGRPTSVEMTKYQIEKQFGRV
ncbi:MAG: DNA mismatch repair endonuclease MutL [Clostridia bacterium]|nr:DNA mismatch repair endonuclease MutL [Clostridia bacterium]